MSGFSRQALQWISAGEHCWASKTMFWVLLGQPMNASPWPVNYPMDPGALRRCMLVIEQVPELSGRICEMGFLCPEWHAIAARWAELTETFVREAAPQGGWQARGTNCPRTYELLTRVINQAREAAATEA